MGAVILCAAIVIPILLLIGVVDGFLSWFKLFRVLKVVLFFACWYFALNYMFGQSFGSRRADWPEYVIWFMVVSFVYLFVIGAYWLLTFPIRDFISIYKQTNTPNTL